MGHDKARLQLQGRTLVQRAIDAIGAPTVVVGHPELAELLGDVTVLASGEQLPEVFFTKASAVALTREEPPLGGPAAGIAAGVATLQTLPDAAIIQVLPCDLPHADQIVRALDEARWNSADALTLIDDEDYPQLLAGRYRLGALRAACDRGDEAQDISIQRLLGGIERQTIPADSQLLIDVDDPTTAQAAGIDIPEYS